MFADPGWCMLLAEPLLWEALLSAMISCRTIPGQLSTQRILSCRISISAGGTKLADDQCVAG
jgi:hypothetical protein